MAFDKEGYLRFLISSGVVGFFPEGRKLKSGRVSHWYANCRVLSDTAGSLKKLAGFVLDFVRDLGIEYGYFFGIPEGSTKLGIMLNYLEADQNNDPDHPIVMGRGKEKNHGDPRDRFVIGPLKKGDRIVAVEDVATTGGSMLKTVDRLRESEVDVQALIVLVDRLELTESGESVKKKADRLGLQYCPLSTAEDLLPIYIRENRPPDKLIGEIEEDFRVYGARQLKLR